MNRRPIASIVLAILFGALGVGLSACGDGPQSTTITDVRAFDKPRAQVPPNAPTWHRFGLTPPRDPDARAPELAWDLPAGWKHAPTSTRPFNFVIEGEADTDAYLSALPKREGTVADNVNRWRKQMGLEPGDDAAVAALPKAPLFGDQATLVELQGTYTPMMASGGPQPNWGMLGLILESQRMFVFFKMVGPAVTLAARRHEFLALAASFRREAADPPPGPSAPSTTPRPGALTWSAPPGWQSQGGAGMREVTFAVDGTQASCWVLFLEGTAGGVAANVNRWLGEVGQKALGDDEVARLPRLNVLGTQGVVVEGTGDYRGMGGPATKGAAMYGLICPLAGRTLFVKMVGPADEMAGQRDNFRALCESLALNE